MFHLDPAAPKEIPSDPTQKFIVEVLPGIDPAVAMHAVAAVIQQGRISVTAGRKHFSHLTTLTINEVPVKVACLLNRKSERFIVLKHTKDKEEK